MIADMLLTAALAWGACASAIPRAESSAGEPGLGRIARDRLVDPSCRGARPRMGRLQLDAKRPLGHDTRRQDLVPALAGQPQSHAGGDRTPRLEDAVEARHSDRAADADMAGAWRAGRPAGDSGAPAQAPALCAFAGLTSGR